MKRIYLDYAALTPIDKKVIKEMAKYSSPEYGNPSSIYKEGVEAKMAVNTARKSIAEFLHGHNDEIVFTGGGTEANGLALEGAGRTAHRNGNQKPHLIISATEHSSIMETARMLEKHGGEVTRLPVNQDGLISVDDLKRSLRPTTYLVSIIMVNNETGVFQPIRQIAKVIRDYKNGLSNINHQPSTNYPLFHTDASQAPLYFDLDVQKLGIDLMTLDGSKVYGPRGFGMLYVRRNTPIEQIIYGGGQERGLRSGTENVPAIMGMAKAFALAQKQRTKETERVQELKNLFIKSVEKVSDFKLTKSTTSPHILNINFPGIDNEFFVLELDHRGIACSTKSSCLRDEDESYVLKAMGRDSRTAVRFSFGRFTRKSDVKKVGKVIVELLGGR